MAAKKRSSARSAERRGTLKKNPANQPSAKRAPVTRAAEKRSAKRPAKTEHSARASPRQPSKTPSPGYDEGLAERIREQFAERRDVFERKMFGGLCFLVSGRMCCGILRDVLLVRVGVSGFDAALAEPHTRVMDFTGRPSRGMVYVDPPGYAKEAQLAEWLRRGLASEPPKRGRYPNTKSPK